MHHLHRFPMMAIGYIHSKWSSRNWKLLVFPNRFQSLHLKSVGASLNQRMRLNKNPGDGNIQELMGHQSFTFINAD